MTETYHIYGFGVELSHLGEISLGRLEQLIDMAPIFRSKIIKWFEDEKIDKPTLENYYEYDPSLRQVLGPILDCQHY